MLKELAIENIIKQIANVIAPDSLAFSDDYGKRYTIQEFIFSEQLKKLIQPGDIIITKTPSLIHNAARSLAKINYDHVAVFLSENDALHVSPPRVRVISSNQFLMEKLQPIIIRPNFASESEKLDFLQRLINQKDQKYDFGSVFRIFQQRLISRIRPYSSGQNLIQKNLKKRIICTDLITFCLAHSSVGFMQCLTSNEKYLYLDQSGSLTPDDLIYLGKKEDYFSQIYPEKNTVAQQNELQKGKLANSKVEYSTVENKDNTQTIQLVFQNNSFRERLGDKRIQEIKKQEKIHTKPKIIIPDSATLNIQNINTIQYMVDKIINIAYSQGMISKKFISIIRLYNADIYIQMIQIIYFIYKLKQLQNQKKDIFSKAREMLALIFKISIATNSILQYYQMEGTVKRLLGGSKL